MGMGAGNNVGVRDHVAVPDGESATGDKTTATKAGHLEHRLGGIVHAGRIDNAGGRNRKRRRQRGLESREDGWKLNPGEDVPDACEKGRALRRDGVQLMEHNRLLDLLCDLLARPTREAQAQEPNGYQHGQHRKRGAAQGVTDAMSPAAQDAFADRLTCRVSDAGSEAASDDQHQDRANRTRDRARHVDVIEHRLRRGGAQQDARQQTEVLHDREPEPAAKAVGEADQSRGNDHQIDEVGNLSRLVEPLDPLAMQGWPGSPRP